MNEVPHFLVSEVHNLRVSEVHNLLVSEVHNPVPSAPGQGSRKGVGWVPERER